MTIKGYKPHPKQREIHNSINHDSGKYYVLNIGRQFGKTMLCNNQQLYWMINDKGCRVGWVSPIYKQSKKVYKELRRATERSGLFEYNDTDMTVTGFGGSIMFFSGERADNIRGNTFDYLIIDEADYLKPNTWEEVLQPTVLVRGKKVVFISTPRGKSLMHRLSLLRHSDNRYRYFHYSSYDNPMIDHREIDSIKETLPDHIFRQEYLAEFIDDSSGVFKNVRACSVGYGNPSNNYGGLDIGRADDYTVLTILNKKNEVVFCERWRHDEWANIIDKVAIQIKKFNAKTFVEVNNQGDIFYDLLKKKVGNLVQPFTTTTKTKPQIIEGLCVDFETMEIQIPSMDWLIDELEAFTYIYNPKTRTVQYSAPQGVHDDGVMSLAIASHARRELKTKGNYQFGNV